MSCDSGLLDKFSLTERRDVFTLGEPVVEFQQKVKSLVIDAELDKIYQIEVNSSIEYILQYSYLQNVVYCSQKMLEKRWIKYNLFQAMSSQTVLIQVASTMAFKDNPILVVVRQQKSVDSWQIPLLLETANGL